MARALYDLCRKDGTVMVYSITRTQKWQQQSAVSCRMFIILRVMDN